MFYLVSMISSTLVKLLHDNKKHSLRKYTKTRIFTQNTLIRIFLYKYKIEDSVLIRENVGQKKPVSLHKKWSFLLRISSVNVAKSAVSYGFGHIYWKNP